MLLVVFGYTVSLEVRGVGRMGLNERSYSLLYSDSHRILITTMQIQQEPVRI